MTHQELTQQIFEKQSYLCVGLDTDIQKIPAYLRQAEDPIFAFNKQIIEATAPYCVAYKPNIAFYEAQGAQGWESLQKTLDYIPSNCFTIADAKRGDIGNTAALYARAFFEQLSFDALTVSPYMGEDSVTPFLDFAQKWVILLALTSNKGSSEFQTATQQVGETPLFEKVIEKSKQWATYEQMMYVVGATQTSYLKKIRTLLPHHFLLIPGVGAQGGSLEEVSKATLTAQGGILVNSTRAIIYASQEKDFAQVAAQRAAALQQEMAQYLAEKRP